MPNTEQDNTDTHEEDDVYLIDYFPILWERKWLILLVSVLPTLLVGYILSLAPKQQEVSYIYNSEMSENDISILESRFYSDDNIKKIAAEFRNTDHANYADKLLGTSQQGLKNIASFTVLDRLDIRNKNKELKPGPWTLHLKTKSEYITDACEIFSQNISQVIPLYEEYDLLKNETLDLREKLITIENSKFSLKSSLETKTDTLNSLEAIKSDDRRTSLDDVTLQFDVNKNNLEYLPLSYQVQAAKTSIINLKTQINEQNRESDHYKSLLDLNNELTQRIEKSLATGETIQQYRLSLIDMLEDKKSNEDLIPIDSITHINTNIQRIDSVIAQASPVTKNPKTSAISNNTTKKTAIVFILLVMISVFVSFQLGASQKRS